MDKREIRKLKNMANEVLEIDKLISSGTGDGRIPAAYRPKIKKFAETVLDMECKQDYQHIRIFLEDDLVNHRDIMFALIQGCKIINNSGNVVWLNSNGELCSINGTGAIIEKCMDQKWTVVSEYDWYKIGKDLADGATVRVTCLCKKDNGWFVDDIVGFAPQLSKPYIGKTNSFYAEVIVLSASNGYELPVMEVH
jgi:hypothetical protein